MIRQIKIKNLGPITQGSFEVKPITLFCGPNNSGKTWAMYSLYYYLNLQHEPSPSLGSLTVFRDMYASLFENSSDYTFSVKEWVTKNGETFIEQVNRIIHANLPNLFNTPSELFESSYFFVQPDLDSLVAELIEKEVNASVSLGRKKIMRLTKKAGHDCIRLIAESDRPPYEIFADRIGCLLLGLGEGRDAFLMPAERNGLHLFFRELSSKRTALLHHASRENIDILELLRDVMQSRYAMPIAHYIDWLNDMQSIQKRGTGDFHPYAKKIKKLVSGSYAVEARTGEITFKPYQKKRDGKSTQRMGLHSTSSAVKSLFGLWFYLENQAKKGAVLMIDEPELNIHPENQRKIARVLAMLVNAGLNVVVSTHSDYIVRELNSLIMLSGDKGKKLREKYGYQKDEVLSHKKIGAYLFDDQKITPFEITPEDGVYATTFDEVIKEINTVNDDIYYSLQESNNG